MERKPKRKGFHSIRFRCLLIVSVILLALPFVLDFINGRYRPVDPDTPKEGSQLIIRDDAHLLDDTEAEGLRSIMESILPYGSAGFFTTDVNPAENTDALANQVYESWFGDLGADGALFVIDMQNRYLVLSNGGKISEIIGDTRCDEVTDNVYRYAKYDAYYDCATSCFSQVANLLTGLQIPHTMQHISNLLISLGLAVFSVFLVALSKTKMKEYSPDLLFDADVTCEVTFGPDDVCKLISSDKKKHPVYTSGSGYSGGSSYHSYSGSSSSGSRSSGYSGGHSSGSSHSSGGGHSSGGHGF